jgi:histidine-containing phosphotransfer peotein
MDSIVFCFGNLSLNYLVIFLQGYLDEQFNQLEELQDETSPNFVEEVVVLFFKDSSRLLISIEQEL